MVYLPFETVSDVADGHEVSDDDDIGDEHGGDSGDADGRSWCTDDGDSRVADVCVCVCGVR